MLDYSARIGLDNVHFSERRYLESFDPAYLRRLRQHADGLGLSVEIGMLSFDRFARSFEADLGTGEAQLRTMIDAAVIVGSPVVRCFLGDQGDRQGAVPFQDHLTECVRVLKAVAPHARGAGVKVAVENHGGVDLLARELRWLIEESDPTAVGACLDTGNPTYGGEDPVLTTEILAPYAVSTHVRDSAVWETGNGAMAQWVPLGEGNVDVARILSILAEKAPECPIDLEIITGYPPAPVPYLDHAGPFWTTFPDLPGRDLVRYLALARDGSRRGLGPRQQLDGPRGTVPAGSVSDAVKAQQLADFEASVVFARQSLGLGRRVAASR
jgi:sugar phosphate isomerase/epimerase